jgi:3'-phosphoadenosine 5'-phosphosulfate sulfotransferase (PAPS reductase)/FAD synthetase
MTAITSYAEQMAIGRVHGRSRAFTWAQDFARDGIDHMMRIAPRSYVSLSFGKQSLCVAHMVYQIAPETPMYFLASDETWHLYDYADVIESFIARWPVKLTIVQTHRWKDGESWKASRDAGDGDLQNMVPRDQFDGWFWGLSQDESRARKLTLLASAKQDTPHASIFRYSDGKLRCCPVMRWTLHDLAAYIATHDLPMLNIYRKFGLTQRTTARVTKKMLRHQGMALARMSNSRGFREIVNRFPEVNVQ